MVERGIIFPKHVAETRDVTDPDAARTTTRVRDKGFIFTRKVAEIDKDK